MVAVASGAGAIELAPPPSASRHAVREPCEGRTVRPIPSVRERVVAAHARRIEQAHERRAQLRVLLERGRRIGLDLAQAFLGAIAQQERRLRRPALLGEPG
jgi:hypothetical protein